MNFKKVSLKALGLLMSVTLVAGMLSSCSKSSSSDTLVESIPSSAMFVIKFNPKQVIENAGCSVDDGKIVLSKKISAAIKDAGGSAALKVVNEYLTYTEGVNLDAVMVFATKQDASDVAVIAALSDEKKVKEHIKELVGKEKEEDGFTVYKMDGGGVVAIKDNMMWFANKLSVVTNHIDNAKDGNITSLKGVAEILTADNAFAYVLSLPKINTMLKNEGVDFERQLVRNDVPRAIASKIAGVMDYYACGSFTLSGNTLSGEAFLVDEQGQRSQFGKFFNVINTDFLKNVPAGANFVAACGNIADADVKALIKEAADKAKSEVYYSTDNEETAQLASDLLTKWDGTAAVAVEYNNSVDMASLLSMSQSTMINTLLEDIKFVLMAHYPQSVVNGLADLITMQAGGNEELIRTVSPNYYEVSMLPGSSIYFGNLNGYFTLGNYSGDSGAASLADKFSGKRFAAYGHMDPSPSMARFGWDFGSEGELWLDDDAVKFTTTLTGTKLNYLQAIIEPLTDMDNLNRMISYFNELNRASYSRYSPYSYDYDYDFYEDCDVEPDEPAFIDEDYEEYLYDI